MAARRAEPCVDAALNRREAARLLIPEAWLAAIRSRPVLSVSTPTLAYGCGGVVTVMAWATARRGKLVSFGDDRGEVVEPSFESQFEAVLEAAWVVRRARAPETMRVSSG